MYIWYLDRFGHVCAFSGGERKVETVDFATKSAATVSTRNEMTAIHNPWDSPLRAASSSSISRIPDVDKRKEKKIPAALRGMSRSALFRL